jgi:2-phosphosulfolactate phosphatase
MKILKSDLAHGHELEGVVVVIDVLRSFTTAAYAFAGGARAVVPAHTLDEINELRSRYPRSLTTGAHGGGAQVQGLDFGNSPSQVSGLDLSGVTLIQYTAGGVRGLIDCDHASEVLAGSLVCAHATAAYIHRLDADTVTFVITGLWTDRDGDEDHACADLIEAYLLGRSPDVTAYERRVRQSDFGRRFGDPAYPHLPVSDLDHAATANCFGFAMPMRRTNHGLVIEPVALAEMPSAN